MNTTQRFLGRRMLVLLLLCLPDAAWAQITAYAVVPNIGDDTVSIIDTRTEQVLGAAIPVTPGPESVAMSPDGRRAYVSHPGKSILTVVDVTRHTIEAAILLPAPSRAAAVSPDNRWVYAIHDSTDTMSVINVDALAVMPFSVAVGVDPWCLAITPDSQYAYVGNRGDMTVSVVHLTLPNPTVTTTIPVTMWPMAISITPDGRTAYLLERLLVFNGAIIPIDIATNTLGAPIAVNPPYHMTLTYDGSLLYAFGVGLSSTVAVFDTATAAGVGSIPVNHASGLAATPNGNFVYFTDLFVSAVQIIDRWTQTLTGRTIAVGNNPGDLGIGPSIIIEPPGTHAALSIARDSDLTARAFRSFVPFNGGTLKTTGVWTTTRTIALLSGGGTIETRAQATVNASTIGPGTLTKTGPSVLNLMGPSRHARTLVKEGVLSVMSVHFADIDVDGGTLAGRGSVGDVHVTRGTIAPGGGTMGPGTLHAWTVTMDASSTFAVTMVGPAEGSYSRLDATTSVDLGSATLTVNPKFLPLSGQTFTIVTNAIGEFGNYTEGDLISTPRGTFRISYFGGPLGQDVVLTAW